MEHFYPQEAIGGTEINDQELHSFGNLCLISHSDNSKYSNYLPDAKSTHYNNKEDLDSIKQFLMIKECFATRHWFEPEINRHHQAMLDLFQENLQSHYQPKSEISIAKKWFNEYQTKDKNLLVRTLLCFGDCAKYISGNRYNLFNFDYILNHEGFSKFEAFIKQTEPKSLYEIINKHLTSDHLKKKYEYLFIKYPKVLEYCKEGNFCWHEESDGKLIYLLESKTRAKKIAKELITFIIQGILGGFTPAQLHTDYECLYINIGYKDQTYFISDDKNAEMRLQIWNEEGNNIMYCVEPLVNGNSKSIKALEEFNWLKTNDGDFVRNRNSIITNLDGDFEEIIENTVKGIKLLFKNGFQIKL